MSSVTHRPKPLTFGNATVVQGIDIATNALPLEKGQVKTLRVFISSPGDVVHERQIAERIVGRLNLEFGGHARLDPYFWEYEPMRLDRNFQDQIPSTSEFDLLICILWSRLGTPLNGPDGRQWASGTEYEVATGLEAYRAKGAPELMIYLNQTPAQIRQLPREERERLMRQLDALENFVHRFCFDPKTGVIKGAFTNYEDLGQFEELLEKHLRKMVLHRAPLGSAAAAASAPTAPRWSGNPFRGLQVFECEHAPIFFGRTRAIGEIIAGLRRQAQQVEEARLRLGSNQAPESAVRAAAFVLVTGMSGIGKSSLIRAGILPLLTQPGDGIGLWRTSVLRPGESSGDLFDGLAAALVREGALPELVRGGQSVAELAGMLRGTPGAIKLLISQALTHAADLQSEQERNGLREAAKEFGKEGRTGDAERCERLAAGLKPRPARLVLVADQLEEIFFLEQATAAQREGFVCALGALARSGWVYVLTTLRSDFFARCAELPELMALKQGDGLYHLQPPTPAEVAQMVRQPALAAGLRFEGDGVTIPPLDEVIRDAALKNPEALPLLEFCLDQLYQRLTSAGVLTHEAYKAIGQLEGAIGQKAEEVFQRLAVAERAAFEPVMRQVTTVALEKQDTFNRRWADYEELAAQPGARGLLNLFCSPEGRLFVTSQTDDGRSIVSVVHEALLSQWPRLKEWLEGNRENLKIRADVALAQSRWRESGRNADYLLPGGFPLAKARQALDAGFLEAAEKEFVRASVARTEGQAKRRERLRHQIISALSVLLVIAIGAAGWAVKKQKEASSESENRKAQLQEAARTDCLIARDLFKQSRGLDALTHLARAITYDPVSRVAPETAVGMLNDWSAPLPVAFILGHTDAVFRAEFSPDGQRIVTASYDKTARVWEAATGKLLVSFQGHTNQVWSARFSPDGRRIVTASGDHTARVWDATTGKLLVTLQGHTNGVSSAQFSHDGQRVVTASSDGTARLWEVETGRLLVALQGHAGSIFSAQFSTNGQLVVTAADDNTARVWDTSTGELLSTLQGHTKGVSSAQFSPDGKSVVTASWDCTARVWDVVTGKSLVTLQGHGNWVNSAQFSPDGQKVVTASQDGMAAVWETASGKPIVSLQGHEGPVFTAQFSPDGQRVVTGSADRTARVWEAATGELLVTLQGQTGAINNVQFSPDGQQVVTASDDHTARVWDAENRKLLVILQGHTGVVNSAQFSLDGQQVVTASDDHTARVWDAARGKVLFVLRGHTNQVKSAEFGPDGRRVVTASDDHTARIWDAASGELSATLHAHTNSILSAHISPDGQRVVTSSDDHTARVWDVASGKLLVTFQGHTNEVRSARFSPDGKSVVTASFDRTTRLWEMASGKLLVTFPEQEGGLVIAEFSPDGRRVLTGFPNDAARLWDVASGKLLATLQGHTGLVESGQFSPDGQQLVTASWDHTARVWEAATGKLLVVLGHERFVDDARFSPDGGRIVTASDDARVWDAGTGKLLVTLQGHTGSVKSGQFSPDGQQVVTASFDGTARVWELLAAALPPPAWFADFLRLVAQRKFNDKGELVVMPPEEVIASRARLETITTSEHSRYAAIARWFLTPGGKRPPRPDSR